MDAGNLQVNDIVIAFMGPTGSGKSNLIDTLTKQNKSKRRAGDKLESCTSDVQALRIRHPSYGDRIVFVDTPGFDDTHRSDMEILQLVGDWLEKTYAADVKLAGIVYLHRITDNRMSGSPHRNLRMFGHLCGNRAADKVVFVTTMWDKVKQSVAEEREQQLKTNYWKLMIELGSKTNRFTNTEQSAWNVIKPILAEAQGEAVLIQEELHDLGKKLGETEAGKTLYTTLQKLLVEQKATLRQLADQASSDPNLAAALESEYKRVETELEKTFKSIKKLKVSLPRRIYLFFAKKARAHSVALA
ncbi:P-loop containing nucleoside triphosphate hydrolase protein [Crassisporium funariophilum]|nr:P-loop containing nucleoside triphosphate hydrolase protein [Crassisporium funariophilum]